MTYIIGSARHNESGGYHGGTPGDQLQTTTPDYDGEVSMQDFYVHSKGWYILRAKSTTIAKSLSQAMQTACNNAHIGYDMDTRLGVITYGINTTTDCNADCSSLVRACCIYAGFDPGNFTTGYEKTYLLNSGYFTNVGTYTTGTALQIGDVLVTKTAGHTAIVVSMDSADWQAKPSGAYALGSDEATDNIRCIESTCLGWGWSDQAVCGMLGNIYAESGLNPWRYQSDSTSGAGYGLFQFTPKSGYLSPTDFDPDDVPGYAPNKSTSSTTTGADPEDGYAQLYVFYHDLLSKWNATLPWASGWDSTYKTKRDEMLTTYGNGSSISIEQFTQIKSINDAAFVFLIAFERPSSLNPQARYDYAASIWEYMTHSYINDYTWYILGANKSLRDRYVF